MSYSSKRKARKRVNEDIHQLELIQSAVSAAIAQTLKNLTEEVKEDDTTTSD